MSDYDEEQTKPMTYEQAGMLSLLPGMRHMLTLMLAEVDGIEARIAASLNGHAPKGVGRPRKIHISEEGMKARKRVTHTYWASMTAEERSAEMRRRGALRKDRVVKVRSGPGGYWDKMTPQERQEEMKRRVAKQGRMQKKVSQANHPRNPDHPGHQAWLAKMRKTSKAAWARLTPEEHAARVAKTVGGRAA